MDKEIEKHIVKDDINLELLLCTEILKLNSLHFGYWHNGEELTMSNLRKAQLDFNDELVSHIPTDVSTILDVGCGIGDLAKLLHSKGYKVSALSPDKNHKKYFEKPPLDEITFYNNKFEDFNIGEKVDLVIMSESQNYFDAQEGLQKVNTILNPGGYLLVCGMFRRERNQFFQNIRNVEKEYIQVASNTGLELIKEVDITPYVLPSMIFANNMYKEYILPFINLAEHYRNGSSSYKKKLMSLIFKKEIKRAKAIHKYYLEYFNPELFQENVIYTTQLYLKKK